MKTTGPSISSIVRSPAGSVFFVGASDINTLSRRAHAQASKCGASIACQKWYAFTPKAPTEVQEQLRIEVEVQGDAIKKRGRKKKAGPG